MAAEPVTIVKLTKAAAVKRQEAEAALLNLREKYNQDKSGGIILAQSGDSYQFVSNPKNAEIVAVFVKSDLSGDLTEPALETLTIVAYRGPITKPELEQVRGVNCSLILRNLLLRGLIEKLDDKKHGLDRYQVTLDFVRFIGLSSVRELPDYEKLHQYESLNEVIESVEEKESRE